MLFRSRKRSVNAHQDLLELALSDEALCELCLKGKVETQATKTIPEPPQGAFGCVPGTFLKGIPLCEECYREWKAYEEWEEDVRRPPKVTLHKDGSVTYWSVYRQQWMNRSRYIPDEELAAMPFEQRDKVMKHLEKAAKE